MLAAEAETEAAMARSTESDKKDFMVMFVKVQLGGREWAESQGCSTASFESRTGVFIAVERS